MKRGSRYYCVYLTSGETVYLWADDDYSNDDGSIGFGNCRGKDEGYDVVLYLAAGQWTLFFEANETGSPSVERWSAPNEDRPHVNLKPAEFRYRNS